MDELGHGFTVLWRAWYWVDADELEHSVRLELDVDGGRLVIASFAVERRPGGSPVTIEALKSMPLVGLISLAVTAGPESGLASKDAGPWQLVDGEAIDRLPELEQVALVYRMAYFIGLSPTKAVALELELSRDVAAKRVQAARRAGLLEPTRKGQKGA